MTVNSSSTASYTSYTGSYSYPNAKYYDKYSYIYEDSSTVARSKLGDAIREVRTGTKLGWYSDDNYMASGRNSWTPRGCHYNCGARAGLFLSVNTRGHSGANVSTHMVVSQ